MCLSSSSRSRNWPAPLRQLLERRPVDPWPVGVSHPRPRRPRLWLTPPTRMKRYSGFNPDCAVLCVLCASAVLGFVRPSLPPKRSPPILLWRRPTMESLDRITVDPAVCLGQPTVRGMRLR